MTRLSSRLTLSALILVVLTLVIFYVQVAANGYITDSEIWSVTLAKNLGTEWNKPWVFTRPLFYGLLGLAEAFPKDAVGIFLAAKWVCLLNGLLMGYLTYRLAKVVADPRLPTGKMLPWIAVLLLFANTGFLTQGYRIRSDLFTGSLLLFVLERSLVAHEKRSLRKVLLWFTPLLATPKALLQLVPFAFFPTERKSRRLAMELTFLLAAAIVLLYPRAIQYFQSTVGVNFAEEQFFSLKRFYYFNRLVSENVLFFVLFFFRWLTFSLRMRRGDYGSEAFGKRQKLFALFVAVSALIMVISPEKVPFFLALYLPFLAIFAAQICEDVWVMLDRLISPQSRKLFFPASLAAMGLGALSLTSNAWQERQRMLIEDNSVQQFQAVKILENLLNQFPKAVYYDVVGLVPQRATIFKFAGPNDAYTNRYTLEYLSLNLPDLIFYVRKGRFLEPDLSRILLEKYFSLGSRIYARWHKLLIPDILDKKSEPIVKEQLAKASAELGVPVPEVFSALVTAEKSRPWRIETDWKGLWEMRKSHRKFKVIAVSPFIALENPPMDLSLLIQFDGNF